MLTWRPYFELGFVEVYAEGVYAGRITANCVEAVSSNVARFWNTHTLTATIVGRRLGCPVSLTVDTTKWFPTENAR